MLNVSFCTTAHLTPEKIAVTTSMRSNNTSMLYQAAIASMGLAILPEWLIEDDLTSGRLEQLDLDCAFSTDLSAVYMSQRYLSPKVRTFVDSLANYLQPAKGLVVF